MAIKTMAVRSQASMAIFSSWGRTSPGRAAWRHIHVLHPKASGDSCHLGPFSPSLYLTHLIFKISFPLGYGLTLTLSWSWDSSPFLSARFPLKHGKCLITPHNCPCVLCFAKSGHQEWFKRWPLERDALCLLFAVFCGVSLCCWIEFF